MKHTKKLLLILSLVTSHVFGQTFYPINNAQSIKWLAAPSYFGLPAGTTPALNQATRTTAGALYWNTTNNHIYGWNGTSWVDMTPITGTALARNAVTFTGSYLELGGSLIKNTTIATDGYYTAFTGTGRFGIGRTPTQAQLEIEGTSGQVIKSVVSGEPDAGIFHLGNKFYWGSWSNTSSRIYIDMANDRFGFGTSIPSYTADVNGTLRSELSAYFATSSGSVGLGTISPDSLLTVNLGTHLKRGVRMPALPSGAGTHTLRVDNNGVISKSDTAIADYKKTVTGRQVIIEEFGAGGNDWSFVRTPDSYTYYGKPHKLVILYHGNGWIMDGTLAKANASSMTQYGVDASNGGAYLSGGGDPLYVQYSSPLIENLLAEGYVVAGSQNFGDELYGNDSCRKAAVDFYNYMMSRYNVEDRVYMVGFSAGGLTALNAIRLLGDSKVSAFVGLYPLVNIIDHYLNYAPHQPGIEAAYDLSTTYTVKSTMIKDKKLWTHDPVNYDVIGYSDSTTQKTFLFPPIYLIASGGDAVVDIDLNSNLLKALCDRSRMNILVEDIDPGGSSGYAHGDYHHFKVPEILDFFKNLTQASDVGDDLPGAPTSSPSQWDDITGGIDYADGNVEIGSQSGTGTKYLNVNSNTSGAPFIRMSLDGTIGAVFGLGRSANQLFTGHSANDLIIRTEATKGVAIGQQGALKAFQRFDGSGNVSFPYLVGNGVLSVNSSGNVSVTTGTSTHLPYWGATGSLSSGSDYTWNTSTKVLGITGALQTGSGLILTDDDGGYFSAAQTTSSAGLFQPAFTGYGTGAVASMIIKGLRSTSATDGTAGSKTIRFITRESDDATAIGDNDIAYTFENGSTTLATILGSGNAGLGTSPTASLHIKAGTATANTAPLKLTSGTNLSTPENGAVEYDGTDYFATSGGTRFKLARTLTGSGTLNFGNTGPGASANYEDLTITVTGAADGDVVYLGVPNGSTFSDSQTGYQAWVSASNTVTVRFYSNGAQRDPASGTFNVKVFK